VLTLALPCCCYPMDVITQSVEEVASSKGALQLLLDGQDYAGALDLLEVSRWHCAPTMDCHDVLS
jgi:hypothetical protein